MRDLLEHSIAARPDDGAAHAAYADWLTEQDDPRGEFIQIQLALEDASRSTGSRRRLREREAELLNAHQRAWLGGLAPLLLDRAAEHEYYSRPLMMAFRRGWLDRLDVGRLTVDLARALADSPLARMLAELNVDYVPQLDEQQFADGPDVPRGERARQHFDGVTLLANSDAFTNLRRLRLGEDPGDNSEFNAHGFGSHVADFVARLPRLEELRLFTLGVDSDRLFALSLPELRTMQVYHISHYPLATLAANPSLGNLTHLRLCPHPYDEGENRVGGGSHLPVSQVRVLAESKRLTSLMHLQLWASNMGDEGIDVIIQSGLLKRLTVLDLRYGCITDVGARMLADCPEARRLELIDLRNNWLTEAGINYLRDAGVPLEADDQAEPGDDRYLYQGEFE